MQKKWSNFNYFTIQNKISYKTLIQILSYCLYFIWKRLDFSDACFCINHLLCLQLSLPPLVVILCLIAKWGCCMKFSFVSERCFFFFHTNSSSILFLHNFIPLLVIFSVPSFHVLNLHRPHSSWLLHFFPPYFCLFSLLLNSVSFRRVLSCSRTRCSRTSSWC